MSSPEPANLGSTRGSGSPHSSPPVAFPVGIVEGNVTASSTSGSDRSATTPPSSIYPFTPDTSPSSVKSVKSAEKKKKSALRKFSITSRRSQAFSPSDNNAEPSTGRDGHQSVSTPPKSLKQRTMSMSSPFQRFKALGPGSPSKSHGPPISAPEVRTSSTNQSEIQSSHSSKGTIGKSIRNVARSVRKSLHQFDRPTGLTSERKTQDDNFQQFKNSTSQSENPVSASSKRKSTKAMGTQTASSPLSSTRANASSTTLRTRTLSEPLSSRPSPRESSVGSPIEKPSSDLPKQTWRPMSAFEAGGRSIPAFGSLPQAAALLARPPPDPTTFLAIIPGQAPFLPGQSTDLTLVPPPSRDNIFGEPNVSATTTLFAHSIRAQPALTPRHSSSDIGDDDSFAFIRSPAHDDLPIESEESGDQTIQINPATSSSDGDYVRRVPSNLEDFTGADWSQFLDESICYPNVGNRHQPVLASPQSESFVHSTELQKCPSVPDFGLPDIPRLSDLSSIHSIEVVHGWSVPVHEDTSQNRIDIHKTRREPHQSVRRSTRRKGKLFKMSGFQRRFMRRHSDPSRPPTSLSEVIINRRSRGGIRQSPGGSSRSASICSLPYRPKRHVPKHSLIIKRRRVANDLVADGSTSRFDLNKALPGVLMALAVAVVTAAVFSKSPWAFLKR